jgi:hypothetical protein
MKKSLFTAFAVGLGLTANLMAQVPSYVPSNGLVGWWPFNGNANDESGNGNNGTVNGATLTTDRFGNANQAYSFDGVDDLISANLSQNLDLNWSFSLWFNKDNLSSFVSQNVVGFGLDDCCFGSPSIGLNGIGASQCIDLTQNPERVYIFDGTSECNNVTILDSLIRNQWFHMLIVKQNNIFNFYLNNALSSSVNNLNFNIFSDIFLGNRHLFSFQFYEGKIDDISIWNRALTECEIQDLYNSQLGSFSNANVSVNPTSSEIGSNATLTVSSPVSSLQWQSNPGNMGWNNVVDNGIYTGATNDTLVVSNLQLSNHNQLFRVLACGDTSNIATIQIADTCITNVTVYDTLLTTVTDTLIINTTLSLPAPNNENTILIYPNPASDHITIDNGNYTAMAGYSIKIENNAGQQVFQSAINQAQFYVDLSTWTGNGLYFVHLIDPQNNTVTVRKIVLQ